MRSKFFLQNITRLGILALIPLCVMGIFSIFITNQYIDNQNRDLNDEALAQMHKAVDSLFLEIRNLDTGISSEYNIQTALRRILTQPITSYEDDLILDLIASNLSAKSSSNPMLHSLYVYYNNENNRFITSDKHIAKIEGFYDGAWFDSYRPNTSAPLYWSTPRRINRIKGGDSDEVVTHFRNTFFDGGTVVANVYVDETNRMLSQLVGTSAQKIVVMDVDFDELFHCNNYLSIPQSIRDALPSLENGGGLYDEQNRLYRVFQTYSKETGLWYFSIIPEFEVTALPRQITALMFTVLFSTLVVTMLFAFFISRNSYNSLHNIFRLIDASITGQPLPEFSHNNDIYGSIASNIVRNFIERDYLKQQLSKNKYQARALELLALQSQMNPHFLFNTLDTIYWRTFALTRKPNEATELIEWLSDILKYSLGSQSSIVRLKEEIANTQSYINIQRIRHRERFNVTWELSAESNELPTLKMILQPMIENCITHAMRDDRMLQIRIRTRLLKNGFLRITITDNGCGIDRDELCDIREKLSHGYTTESHIGMFNTNKRIMLACGEGAKLSINSRRNFGTRINIEYSANLNFEISAAELLEAQNENI